jgi:hydroxyethylthiazole kinase
MVIQPFNKAKAEFRNFRQQVALVHCMTNEVVQEFTANVLLAIGSSPAMIVASAEAGHFAKQADALLINVGTLYPKRDQAMQCAVEAACESGTPWVLDPVAVGILAYRTYFCEQLLLKHPSAIRGNASEIIALSSGLAAHRGVESANSSESALENAISLAQRTKTIVAVTGKVDYITDGKTTYAIKGGHILMTRVVGTGCALSALVAAMLANTQNPLQATATACVVFSIAAQKAASAITCQGPGSFKIAFLDALYHMDQLIE